LPADSYELLLHLPDAAASLAALPAYAIRLANRELWEPETGYNALRASISIGP
jgi:hypothetical protein